MSGMQRLIVPFYLFLCLILGGASNAGFVANALLQLLAIPILLWALLSRRDTPALPNETRLLWLLGLALLVPLIQLVPLPPDLWASLPARDRIAAFLQLLQPELPWLPASLAPYRTISSALWLLPAMAVLAAMVRRQAYSRSGIAAAILAAAMLSVPLAAIQVTGGGDSPGYFYQITNRGVGVGFFANSNHLAIFLLCAIPFLAALHLRARGREMQQAAALSLLLISALLALVVGIAVNGSLAGWGLLLPIGAASVLMILDRRRRLPAWWPIPVMLLTIGAVSFIALAPVDSLLIGEGVQVSVEARRDSFTHSLAATGQFFPWGSGLGTFPLVYPSLEDPTQVTRTFMNHVHNDYIELALETGLPGMAVILLFLLWWGRRATGIWMGAAQRPFAQAATIASMGLLVHSMVDYPLRTAALSALFAACCALMIERRSSKRAGSTSAPRHLVVE